MNNVIFTSHSSNLSPDFKLGPLDLGLNFNLYLPLKSANFYPSDLSFVTLRYLGYDDGQFGIQYGRLQNVTYGYGLLMDNEPVK